MIVILPATTTDWLCISVGIGWITAAVSAELVGYNEM